MKNRIVIGTVHNGPCTFLLSRGEPGDAMLELYGGQQGGIGEGSITITDVLTGLSIALDWPEGQPINTSAIQRPGWRAPFPHLTAFLLWLVAHAPVRLEDVPEQLDLRDVVVPPPPPAGPLPEGFAFPAVADRADGPILVNAGNGVPAPPRHLNQVPLPVMDPAHTQTWPEWEASWEPVGADCIELTPLQAVILLVTTGWMRNVAATLKSVSTEQENEADFRPAPEDEVVWPPPGSAEEAQVSGQAMQDTFQSAQRLLGLDGVVRAGVISIFGSMGESIGPLVLRQAAAMTGSPTVQHEVPEVLRNALTRCARLLERRGLQALMTYLISGEDWSSEADDEPV